MAFTRAETHVQTNICCQTTVYTNALCLPPYIFVHSPWPVKYHLLVVVVVVVVVAFAASLSHAVLDLCFDFLTVLLPIRINATVAIFVKLHHFTPSRYV